MNETVKLWFRNYAYLKLCWIQAMGHVNIPLTIGNNLMLLAVFLKVFGIINWWLIGFSGIFMLVGIAIVGHIAIKTGMTAYEQSITNQQNPELKVLLNKK